MREPDNQQNNEFYQKGLNAFKKKNYAYAIELFQEILRDNPDFSECRHYLWNSLREHKKNNASIYNKLKDLIPAIFLNIKLTILVLSGQTRQAVDLAEKIVTLIPDNITAYMKLATVFTQAQDNLKAITAFEEILFLDRKNIGALSNLARLYFKQGNYKKAKATSEILLDITTQNLDAENILKDIAALGAIEKGFDDIKPAT